MSISTGLYAVIYHSLINKRKKRKLNFYTIKQFNITVASKRMIFCFIKVMVSDGLGSGRGKYSWTTDSLRCTVLEVVDHDIGRRNRLEKCRVIPMAEF